VERVLCALNATLARRDDPQIRIVDVAILPDDHVWLSVRPSVSGVSVCCWCGASHEEPPATDRATDNVGIEHTSQEGHEAWNKEAIPAAPLLFPAQ
jgi:hypothetical protein